MPMYFSACRHTYHIDGEVEMYGYEGERLSLIAFDGRRFHTVDSCNVHHGVFTMEGHADSVILAVLYHNMRPIMPVFIERGDIKVYMKDTELLAEGTRQNNLLYTFLKKKADYDNRFEDLMQRRTVFDMWSGDDSISSVVKETEDYIFSFVSHHYNEPAGLSVFSMMCNAQPHNELTPLLKRILDEAPKSFLDKNYVRYYISASGYTRESGNAGSME